MRVTLHFFALSCLCLAAAVSAIDTKRRLDLIGKGPGRPNIVLPPLDTTSILPVPQTINTAQPTPPPASPEQLQAGEQQPATDQVEEPQPLEEEVAASPNPSPSSAPSQSPSPAPLPLQVTTTAPPTTPTQPPTTINEAPAGNVPIPTAAGNGQGFFPCHPAKSRKQTEVTCSTVRIPPAFCSRCALKPVTSNGQFARCNDIFQLETPSCQLALEEYVDLNRHCDPVREQAVDAWKAGDASAATQLDYFMYSVCELCCDCVPMGISAAEYPALKAAHSEQNPALWAADRGNCPAHAQYDLCNVLPSVQAFVKPGEPDMAMPPACPTLNTWLNSARSTNWQTNPDASIDDSTRIFLNGALRALECEREDVWRTCFHMEDLQNNIDIPGSIQSAPAADDVEEPGAVNDGIIDSSGITPGNVPASPAQPMDINTDSATSSENDITTSSPATPTTATTTAPPTTALPITAAPTTATTAATTQPAASTTIPPTTTTVAQEESAGGTTPAAEETSSVPGAAITSDSPITVGGQENGAYGSPSPTPSADGDSCFPASATVELASGTHIPMYKLQIGDRVRVSSSEFSDVYMFSHRDIAATEESYVRISTLNNSVIMTSGHYLPIVNGNTEGSVFVQAHSVQVGDHIHTATGDLSRVTEVLLVKAHGLYNPHTESGTICVDGVVTSTFTRSLSSRAAHAMLSPIRALYSVGVVRESTTGKWFTSGVDRHLTSLVKKLLL